MPNVDLFLVFCVFIFGIKMSESNVVQFYSGKNIFLTGGTGFVGICLIEKLLRNIPDIGKIYLLMRPKKGKQIQERLEEIKLNSVFEKLNELKTEDELKQIFSKLYAIAGDVGEKNLGLSEEDRSLLCKEVNVVFHSAATLDFEATIRPTVLINLLGTRQIAELCGNIQNLNCLVHISSTYVNSFLLKAEEIIYPLSEDPERVIKLVEELDEVELNEMTPKLLGDHPNTYTFTKHMAEHEIVKFEARYPCAIVRPSQICGSWVEPMPGWTISKNGPQGFVFGAAMGVVRRLPMSTTNICDYIPVDTVINTLISAAAYVGTTKPKKVEVFHASSSTRKPFSWNQVDDKINGYLNKYPLKAAVWYPHLKLVPTYTWFRISAFFVHILPAIMLDGVLKISGGRPKLLRMHKNINKSVALLQKFIFTEWTFPADNTEELQKWLTGEDKTMFNVSLAMLDWRNYFINMNAGVRTYLCKESAKSLPAARNKNKFLYVMHMIVQVLIYASIWYLTSVIFGSTLSRTALVLPFTYFLLSLI